MLLTKAERDALLDLIIKYGNASDGLGNSNGRKAYRRAMVYEREAQAVFDQIRAKLDAAARFDTEGGGLLHLILPDVVKKEDGLQVWFVQRPPTPGNGDVWYAVHSNDPFFGHAVEKHVYRQHSVRWILESAFADKKLHETRVEALAAATSLNRQQPWYNPTLEAPWSP